MNTKEFFKKNEEKVRIGMYLWLIVLNILFIYALYIELNYVKIILYLIWLTITWFIIDTTEVLIHSINEFNESKFLTYSILFFWLNVSCAFFLYDQILHDLLLDIILWLENYMNSYREK